ncbi:MAG: hypothetical protein K2I63_01070, partial [Helicobacter sp.]|nr:hypothetical protein [Helicobacter sp.]
KPHLPSRPIALEKLEIIYQKHQKLLANPAKPYVTLKEAIHLYDLLQFLLDRFQLIMPEYEKLITILDELQFTINSAQKESIQKNTTKDSALEISEIMQDLEESLSHS